MGAPAPALIAPTTRRERRRHEVRTRIIDAAVELFDAKGVAATTVGEICDAADVAEKTFFNHYASKPDMVREVARVKLDETIAMIAEAGAAAAGGEGRIERFFRLLADRVETAGPMRRELLSELVHVAHEAGTGPAQAKTLHGAFAALVSDDATPRGRRDDKAARGRRADAAVAVELVLGAFYALMLSWANIEKFPFRKRAVAMARFLDRAIADAARRRR
jgi:AcrR family transcriptional regulator